MPLYLVRWPNLSVSIVNAKDREHLVDILDEVDNPEGVEVWEYDGPLFIAITLPTDRPTPIRSNATEDPNRPYAPEDIELGDLSRIVAREIPDAIIPDTEAGLAMYGAILAQAFPHLFKVLDEQTTMDEHGELHVDPGKLEAAVREEAMMIVRQSWRWANVARSDDPEARVAMMMGTSVENVRALRKRIGLGPEPGPEPDSDE